MLCYFIIQVFLEFNNCHFILKLLEINFIQVFFVKDLWIILIQLKKKKLLLIVISDEDKKIKSFKEVSNLIKGNVIRDLNSNQNLRKTKISNTANTISFEDEFNNKISKNIMFII